jgi:hypothetical protein
MAESEGNILVICCFLFPSASNSSKYQASCQLYMETQKIKEIHRIPGPQLPCHRKLSCISAQLGPLTSIMGLNNTFHLFPSLFPKTGMWNSRKLCNRSSYVEIRGWVLEVLDDIPDFLMSFLSRNFFGRAPHTRFPGTNLQSTRSACKKKLN